MRGITAFLFAAIAFGLTFVGSQSAEAKSIYLNNVNIDSLANQKFENCTVEIDAKGNVFITAKGYRVEVAGQQQQQTQQPAGKAPTKRYWLVTEKPAPGMDQYELEVFINNQMVKRIASKDEQIYLEVTKYMFIGPNQVTIIAKKVMETERKSTQPAHYSRVIIGEGASSDRTIVIEKQMLDYKRTAAEIQPFSNSYTLEAQ